MKKEELVAQIFSKKSFLCVGLDPDIEKIPKHLYAYDDPIFEFNKAIIEATKDFCVAYKPNIAFYEALGSKGWESLQKTMETIPPDFFTIADAKRSDIGNTSTKYANAFFKKLDFDAITLNPLLGADSIVPYLEFSNKWVILLALTSNPSSSDFFKLDVGGSYFFEKVIEISKKWGSKEQIMYVVGATQVDSLEKIRAIIPDHFLLVPGIGVQGGSIEEVAKYAMTQSCGLLVNSSRSIIYASKGRDFAEKAAIEAEKIQKSMQKLLKEHVR